MVFIKIKDENPKKPFSIIDNTVIYSLIIILCVKYYLIKF